MRTLVECVPNFSEGRDAAKVEAIIQALLAGPEVYLLDQEMDADHNGSVITLVGTRESIGEAALRGIGRAAELIDLNQHRGAHPRLGATDVVPFVPVSGVTLEDCIRIAEWVAEEAWRRFRIPTYLYEAAARKAERRNLAQVSMNLTDFETTGIGVAFDAVKREAAAQGAEVAGSEIVGLVPRQALVGASVHYLRVENFHPELILENRLEQVLAKSGEAGGPPAHPASEFVEKFVGAVAAPMPTPGGGSVSALAGALAAALGEMVCGLTLKRESHKVHHKNVEESLGRLSGFRRRLLENVDRDAASYEAVRAAMKLPKSTEAEKVARAQAIEAASKAAALVPLETAELVREARPVIESLQATTIPQTASDLSVALYLTE